MNNVLPFRYQKLLEREIQVKFNLGFLKKGGRECYYAKEKVAPIIVRFYDKHSRNHIPLNQYARNLSSVLWERNSFDAAKLGSKI